MIANYPDRGVSELVVEANIPKGVVIRVDCGSAACRLDYEDVSDDRLAHYARLAASGYEFIHVVTFNRGVEEEKARYDRRVSAGVVARDIQLHNEQYLKRYSQSIEEAQESPVDRMYVGRNTEKMTPAKYLKMCKDYATPFMAEHRGKFILNIPAPGSHCGTQGQRNRLTNWLQGMFSELQKYPELHDRIKFSVHAYPGVGVRFDLSEIRYKMQVYGFENVPLVFTEAGLTQEEVSVLTPEQIVSENERIQNDIKEQLTPIDEMGFHVLSHKKGYGAISDAGITAVGNILFTFLDEPSEPRCKVEYIGSAWPYGHRYRVTKDGKTRNYTRFRKLEDPIAHYCK